MTAMPDSDKSTLRHGKFLGHYDAERSVDGIALAELKPTVPEHEVHTHTHEDAHFLLLLSGNYLSSATGMPDVCSARALVVNPPGTRHRDRFRGLDGRFFTLSIPAGIWFGTGERGPLPSQARQLPPLALSKAAGLCSELRHWDSASALVVDAQVHALLDDVAGAAREEPADGPAWLDRARSRLRDDCAHPPTSAELARLADLHPVYFSRAFRRRYGCTPGEYLRRCRIERAIPLLDDGSLELADIAASCGFVDQSHFSHVFKRLCRITPKRYRELL